MVQRSILGMHRPGKGGERYQFGERVLSYRRRVVSQEGFVKSVNTNKGTVVHYLLGA